MRNILLLFRITLWKGTIVLLQAHENYKEQFSSCVLIPGIGYLTKKNSSGQIPSNNKLRNKQALKVLGCC